MSEEEIIDILKSPLLKSDGYERHQKAIERFIIPIPTRKRKEHEKY